MKDRYTIIIFTLLFIAGVTVVLISVNRKSYFDDPLKQEMVSFQHAIGGVGMGAVMVPAWNFSDYDPRLQESSEDAVYPVPAGYSFSPDRLSMVSSFELEGKRKE